MVRYLGQAYGSRSSVKGQGHEVKNVHLDVPLTSESQFYGPAKKEAHEYDAGCFQSICVFF